MILFLTFIFLLGLVKKLSQMTNFLSFLRGFCTIKIFGRKLQGTLLTSKVVVENTDGCKGKRKCGIFNFAEISKQAHACDGKLSRRERVHEKKENYL